MAAKTHILILSSWYPSDQLPFLGNYIQQFAGIMSSRYQITVISLEKNNQKKNQFEIHEINENFKEVRFYYSHSVLKLSKIKAHKQALEFAKVQLEKVHLLHVNIGLTNWWHFLKLKKALNVPMLYSEHGSFYLPHNFKELSIYNRLSLKKLLKSSDGVTAVSEILAAEMKKNSGNEIHIIGNSLPEKWRKLPLVKPSKNGTYKFLHISTVDSLKNPIGILKAALILKENNIKDFQLTILSEEDTHELEKFVNSNNLIDNVQFLGAHQHDDLPNVYSQHDCFILNSNCETFSIVLAEAMFFGLHILSTKVGFLTNSSEAPFDEIEFNKPSGLASKMEEAIKMKKRSGNAGRKFVKQFSENDIIQRYAELYEKLIN